MRLKGRHWLMLWLLIFLCVLLAIASRQTSGFRTARRLRELREEETTRRYGKISVPGAFTPTEILNAWTHGADVVKVFPATTLGPGYFKDILPPCPSSS